MKQSIKIVVITVFALLPLYASSSEGEQGLLLGYGEQGSTTKNIVYLSKLESRDPTPDSTIQFKAGARSLENLSLLNSHYDFSYPGDTTAAAIGIGWESTPLQFVGKWGGRLGLGYGLYTADVSTVGHAGSNKLRLHVLPVDASVVYLADYHRAMRWFLPAAELGGAYNLYMQTGDVDEAQVRGTAWTAHWSVGVRHSLEWLGFNNSQLTFDYRSAWSALGSEVNFGGKTWLLGFASRM